MSDLLLPKLSLSMDEARIVSWLVSDGDAVRVGQPVATVETDKAEVDVEADADGVIELLAAVDAVVPVEAVIARIGAAQRPSAGLTAADLSAAPPPASSFAAVGDQSARPAAAAPVGNGAPATPGRRLLASPAARRRAAELGVDLRAVTGRGPGGRIVADDVADHASRPEPPADEAVVERPAPVAAVSEPRSVAGGRAGTDLRPAVVAALVRGWQTIPHVNIGGELDAQGLVTARAGARATPRVSYTDLLLLALARALGDVPDLAAVVDADGRATRVGRLDLSLAVATSRGVVAPRIVDVPALGLPGVARERERLVDAARGGRLDRRDLAPGCCTLSNLGSYPVDFFTPVLSGPGACMVATGRIAERVVARDGLIGVRPRIWANVCIDHRAADGEAGGRLLQALERRIQDLPRTI